MKLTFANQLTIIRILCVPFFVATLLYYNPQKEYLRFVATGIFLFAVSLDVLDGYMARVFNQATKVGAILDPLADKILLISAFVFLYMEGSSLPLVKFPIWYIVGVISRDVILLIGSVIIHFVNGDLRVHPTFWGKATTFFQVTSILGVLLQWPLTFYFWDIALVFTVISGIDYLITGIKMLNDGVAP